jgi:GT2 family glycosyltransferase
MTVSNQDAALKVQAAGKFFRLGERKWHLKGFSYGPFAPNAQGQHLPSREQLLADFRHMRQLGANCLRLYHAPTGALLDDALEHGLRVLVDVPWQKHRCFFEDWEAQEDARRRVRQAAARLGDHPGLFALSVANELPNDIVRFYGRRRVERFLDELLDTAKQESPDCLATFVNFPTTEFLVPSRADFCCFNVYLHDAQRLGAYLNRLQHIAGNAPLVLGEYGLDSIREGEAEQAARLARHVQEVFQHGLAGSFVFSYTDDWFTGGHAVADWAFGVTRRDRSEKPAAAQLSQIWSRVPAVGADDLPTVSVVVCSYNGAATLEECLRSLMELDYPDYEVILVDDGSQDRTPQIADQFPQVVYLRQRNLGLSVARNVGARAAKGEVVAYTDSDCVADEHWLRHLVKAMRDQHAPAIGGPNISPPRDSWVAQCVAASPGNPSHVMLDDCHAEHVPGCNMAFDRQVLLSLGGFDPQFRQAGDDVDICWRLLDAGYQIGYAPGAIVWHHRRSTVSAYLRQQKGYGRSEAVVYFKHPQRFNAVSRPCWQGVIYGEGAVGLPLIPPAIYQGRFGSALFQSIYRGNQYSRLGMTVCLEWHLLAAALLLLTPLFAPLVFVSLALWSVTLAVTGYSAWQAPLPRQMSSWSRWLVWLLHILQPIVRGGHRLGHVLWRRALLTRQIEASQLRNHSAKRISATQRDLYWQSRAGHGREALLEATLHEARRLNWPGWCGDGWVEWDLRLMWDSWHDVVVRTATEELGGLRRFTRARVAVEPTWLANAIAGTSLFAAVMALASGQAWATVMALALSVVILARFWHSRRQCLQAAAGLFARAAMKVPLESISSGDTDEEELPPLPPVGSVEQEAELPRAMAARPAPTPILFEESMRL